MLFRSFGHWLLILFGSFVFTVCLLVAAKLGVLGQAAYDWVVWTLDEFNRFYLPNEREIDFAVRAIGAIGTALGAAWTVHKGRHYAEKNLPKRVEEASKRSLREAHDARPSSIGALQSYFADLPVDPALDPLARWFSWIHDSRRWAIADCQERVDRGSNDFRILTAGRVSCRAKLITAHLEHGARLSRQRRGLDALNEFRKALQLNRTDQDALELAGRQALGLKQMSVAQRYFEALEAACTGGQHIERRLRAMRFQAETLKSGSSPEQMKARNVLKTAIAVLNQPNSLNGDVKARELCLTQGQLADVQTIRNTLHSARSACDQAFVWLDRIDGSLRSDVGEWLNGINTRLEQAESDRDSDKENDEDSPDDAPPSDPPKPPDGAA